MISTFPVWGWFLAVAAVFGIVVAFIKNTGSVVTWLTGVYRRLRPEPPKMRFKSTGGVVGRQIGDDGSVDWHNAIPSFTLLLYEPEHLYDVRGGYVGPNGERREHPKRVEVMTRHVPERFNSASEFRVPPEWLAGYVGSHPERQLPYFVTCRDGRRHWDGSVVILGDDEEEATVKFRRSRSLDNS